MASPEELLAIAWIETSFITAIAINISHTRPTNHSDNITFNLSVATAVTQRESIARLATTNAVIITTAAGKSKPETITNTPHEISTGRSSWLVGGFASGGSSTSLMLGKAREPSSVS